MRKYILAATVLFAAQAADATIITVNGNFTASSWGVYFGTPAPAPIDPLFLKYSLTFDTAQTYTQDMAALTINSTNIPYAIKFSFQGGGSTIILATDGGPTQCNHVVNSFCAFIDNFTTGTPGFVEQTGDTGGWVANEITAVTGGVPEPASWAMLIAGFGLVGAASRRRRAVVAV